MSHQNDSQPEAISEYMKQINPMTKYVSAVFFGLCWLMGVHAILVFKLSLIPMLIFSRTALFRRVKKMHSRYNEGDLSDSETRFYKRMCLLQNMILGWGLGGFAFVLVYYAVYIVPNYKMWE